MNRLKSKSLVHRISSRERIAISRFCLQRDMTLVSLAKKAVEFGVILIENLNNHKPLRMKDCNDIILIVCKDPFINSISINLICFQVFGKIKRNETLNERSSLRLSEDILKKLSYISQKIEVSNSEALRKLYYIYIYYITNLEEGKTFFFGE